MTILVHSDLPARIWPLPARTINGIGPRASAKLKALGIRTIGDLAVANPQRLNRDLPPTLRKLAIGCGLWARRAPRGHRAEPKSLSREMTFEHDLHPRGDREVLTQILLDLAQRLSADLARKGYLGKTIGLKLRYEDFRTLTRAVTLDRAIADTHAIRAAARACSNG